MIIAIFCHLDVFAVFYMFWFILLVFRDRQKVEKWWKITTIAVAISIIVQCLVVLVFYSIVSCADLIEWQNNLKDVLFIHFNLKNICDSPQLLIWDFVLLTFLTCQVIL